MGAWGYSSAQNDNAYEWYEHKVPLDKKFDKIIKNGGHTEAIGMILIALEKGDSVSQKLLNKTLDLVQTEIQTIESGWDNPQKRLKNLKEERTLIKSYLGHVRASKNQE